MRGAEFGHPHLRTFSARTFFALGHAHEPLGRLPIQHFARVVADQPAVAPPQRAQLASQAITSSMRGRFSGSGLRPGWGLRSRGSAIGSRRDSASTSSRVVEGSCSINNSSCRSLSVSLAGPRNPMRCLRNRSSSC